MSNVEINVDPPDNVKAKDRPTEKALVDAAMENRGQWVSVEDQDMNPNAYARIYRAAANRIGVRVKLVGNTKYLIIP